MSAETLRIISIVLGCVSGLLGIIGWLLRDKLTSAIDHQKNNSKRISENESRFNDHKLQSEKDNVELLKEFHRLELALKDKADQEKSEEQIERLRKDVQAWITASEENTLRNHKELKEDLHSGMSQLRDELLRGLKDIKESVR